MTDLHNWVVIFTIPYTQLQKFSGVLKVSLIGKSPGRKWFTKFKSFMLKFAFLKEHGRQTSSNLTENE